MDVPSTSTGFNLDELPPIYTAGPYSKNQRRRKGCFVPQCTSTTTRNPEKLFIPVPVNLKKRKKWFKLARRPYSTEANATSQIHACQDHFDIEDICNYIEVKMGFTRIVKLKSNVSPKYFDCQVDRPTAHTPKPRNLVEKKTKLKLIESFRVADEQKCSTESTSESEIPLAITEDTTQPSHLDRMQSSKPFNEMATNINCQRKRGLAEIDKSFGGKVKKLPISDILEGKRVKLTTHVDFEDGTSSEKNNQPRNVHIHLIKELSSSQSCPKNDEEIKTERTDDAESNTVDNVKIKLEPIEIEETNTEHDSVEIKTEIMDGSERDPVDTLVNIKTEPNNAFKIEEPVSDNLEETEYVEGTIKSEPIDGIETTAHNCIDSLAMAELGIPIDSLAMAELGISIDSLAMAELGIPIDSLAMAELGIPSALDEVDMQAYYDHDIKKPLDDGCAPAKQQRNVMCQVDLKRDNREVGTQTKRLNVEDKSTQTMKIDLKNLPNLFIPSACDIMDTYSDDISENGDTLKVIIHTVHTMKEKSREYMGLSKDRLELIDTIHDEVKVSKLAIMLTLRKIKLDEPLATLALSFDRKESDILHTLQSSIPKLGSYLKKYVFWPDEELIRNNLPAGFKRKYSNVESIIGCFEIRIENPPGAEFEALTYSAHKQGHTLKYLLSITPAGFINFISGAFGGSAEDTEVVECSAYLDNLRPNVAVMVHRGFDNLEALLSERNCTLIKAASDNDQIKLTAKQKLEAKMIRLLTIQIDRVIDKLTEYKIICPGNVLQRELVDYVDDACLIVGALININKLPVSMLSS